MTHTLIIRHDNQHITYWASKWPREIGDVINFDGNKYKVIDVLASRDQALMTFNFLPGKSIFEHFKNLFW